MCECKVVVYSTLKKEVKEMTPPEQDGQLLDIQKTWTESPHTRLYLEMTQAKVATGST